MSDKKRELTDWEKAECLALKTAIDSFNEGKPRRESLTQGKIAEALDISQGSVSSYLNGYNALNMRVAAVIAGKLGISVDSFSPRLAAEIAEVAQSVRTTGQRTTEAAEQQASYAAGQAAALLGLATPRSRAVLQRINQAAIDGRLSEADIDLLDQIAARFEHKGGQAPGGEGSHKRLREKLLDHDPHSKK